ncbi:hypothetical protein JCM5350_006125 [Sporobolomyces pararoseus]
MGKNSKKQRDQKRYDQELEARKKEDRLRKEEAKQSRSAASVKVAQATKEGTEEDAMPPLEDFGSRKETAQNEGDRTAGRQEADDEEVEWQEGEDSITLRFPEDQAAREAKASGIVQNLDLDACNPLTSTSTLSALEAFAEVVLGGLSELEKNGIMFFSREANAQLQSRRLPLPRGVDRKELFIPRPQEVTAPWHDKPRLDKSSKESDFIPQAESKVNQLRSDNSELKSNLSALKAEVKDAYQARDKKEGENEELRSRISGVKEEQEEKIKRLREENTRLKTTSSTFTHSSSSKSTVVVQALSRQVKDLSRELKKKNDQLAELMTELTKSG